MSDDKRGVGRPRIHPVEGARRNVTMQASLDLYERLSAAAERSGLSLGREMERRLEDSFGPNEAMKAAIREVLDEREIRTIEGPVTIHMPLTIDVPH